MLPVGSRLGSYEIIAPLHLGATEAYRAYDHGHRREVTLQVFRVEFGAEPERRRAFEADVRPAAALSHPNIPEIYDVGTDARAAYIVSVPLTGETLRARIDARTMSLGDAAQWSVQIARALRAARRNGVRHGHLRADNVVLEPDGRVVVLGFGLASLAPAARPASDVAALTVLTGAMLRAGWQASPFRRRVAWMTAAVIVVIAIGLAVTRINTISDEPVTPAAAAADGTRREGTEPTGVSTLEPELPPPPVGPPVAGRSNESAAGATPETLTVADAPPASPSAKPGPAAAEPAPRLPAAATSARPLTPVVADGRDAASLMTEASVRATEFDLAGAFELLTAAADRGDVNAQVAALYIGGLLDAREAFREGGPAALLAPIRQAIASLEAIAKGRPGSAEIARLTLQAAAAASQSERDEMSLYLETALEMESLQRIAGLAGAPLVAAAEAAGDLWLQVHRYEDARRAYTDAAERVGFTLRILSGLARAARRLNDTAAACASYRRLLDAWGGRPGLPVEVAEARAYVGGCAP
jgi:hypothetical protein